ncbi:MAG TPA: SDR family oxidoreductase [Candidatus Dormibacteraeota bacterium]|nr:SDR family oxidoreductase [Candidatus Dormibacteraeota bacterium]
MSAMRVLIVGCGYVGLPLARELVQRGHEVFGLRRSQGDPGADRDLTAAGIQPLQADITQSDTFRALPPSERFEWVINAVSSRGGGAEEYRALYVGGTRHLLEWLGPSPAALKKYVHLSSTSVYGQADGSLVKEHSPTEPSSATSRVLVETEGLLLEAARARNFPAVLLRVGGIYGPGRGHLFLQYLRDEARIQGKGERFLNMIHLDDLVTAVRTALQSGRPGEIYNVVDDEPVAQIHFFRWLSETLGKWMPPFATEEENAARKRGSTNKKVSNRRLRMELGVALKYPTFRQGYTAEITRLERAGELIIKPAER